MLIYGDNGCLLNLGVELQYLKTLTLVGDHVKSCLLYSSVQLCSSGIGRESQVISNENVFTLMVSKHNG